MGTLRPATAHQAPHPNKEPCPPALICPGTDNQEHPWRPICRRYRFCFTTCLHPRTRWRAIWGLAPRTVLRWLRSGQASRPVMLALFWESRRGRSAANGEAANHGAVHFRHALSLQR